MYYMASRRNSENARWEKCKSKTLIGAKREASKRYNGGYHDAVLLIAIGDNIASERELLASKKHDCDWVDIEEDEEEERIKQEIEIQKKRFNDAMEAFEAFDDFHIVE